MTTNLSCPDCGASVDTDHVDRSLNIANCTHCDSVFALPVRAPARPATPQVDSVTTSVQGDTLTLTMDWWKPVHIALVVFTITWCLMMCAVLISIVLIPFALFHLLIAAGLVYTSLAMYLNQTTVVVHRDTLQATHGPVPWRGSPQIPAQNVVQLYIEQVVHYTRRHTRRATWNVKAILDDHTEQTLLTKLQSKDLARYLEHRIEDHLGIIDRPVVNEDL